MPSVSINTAAGTEFYDHWYSPHTAWSKPGLKWCRLPECYSFDLERLRAQIADIRKQFDLRPFVVSLDRPKKRMTYRGIGITARPEAEDPLYDSLRLYAAEGELDIAQAFRKQREIIRTEEKETSALYEKNFSRPTELYDGYLKEILGKFKSPLTKTRLLELLPRGVITSHVDFPFYQQIRVHAVIETNDDVWWEVEGEKFQLPADGHFYWFDTGRYHAVWNDGQSSRLVLSVNLTVFEDRAGQATAASRADLIELIAQGEV